MANRYAGYEDIMTGHQGDQSEYSGFNNTGAGAGAGGGQQLLGSKSQTNMTTQPTSMGGSVDTQDYWKRPEMSQYQESMNWIDKDYPRPGPGKSYTPEQLRYGRSDAAKYKLPQEYIDQRFPSAPVQAPVQAPPAYDEEAARRRIGTGGMMIGN